MTQTLDTKEDPLNLGGGWASSAPLGTWSSGPRRRGYSRRPRYGPKAEYKPPRNQPKQQYGPGPWFQPPRRPYWAVHSTWGRGGGPWRPPRAGFRKPPGRVQVIRVCGLHPLWLCCCPCCHGPWNPGWARPPRRKRRWGRRGRGLRRHPRRSAHRSPPLDLSTLLRPVNLYGWRAPGMRAPRNTTQFIMNQIYEDMRQQEKLERQQAALRAQQAPARGAASPEGAFGNDGPPGGGQEDGAPRGPRYSFAQSPSLVFSPDPDEEKQPAASQLVEGEEGEAEEEEEWCDQEDCDGTELESQEEEGAEADCMEEQEEEGAEADCMEEQEEEEEEEEGAEADCMEEQEEEEQEEEGAEADCMEEQEEEEQEEEGAEADCMEEQEEEQEDLAEETAEEEGLAEDEQMEEENRLPLETPLSFLMGAEEERENFMNYTYLSPRERIPQVPQETLSMVQDINC